MIRAVSSEIIWTIPYLVAGLSAPFIFKYAPTPLQGGHWAGGLFIFSQVWALSLVFGHDHELIVKLYFLILFPLSIIFWSWRFYNDIPLKEAHLLGFSGGAWHGMLTSLYLVGALALLISEVYSNK